MRQRLFESRHVIDGRFRPLEGVDVIGHSLSYRKEILDFATKHWAQQPWLSSVAERMKARISTT